MKFLEGIHEDAERAHCCLIWDIYPSHRSEAVVLRAAEFNIELLFIPAGMTATYQPFDIRIFGELKMKAMTAFERYKITNLTRDID